MKEVVQVKNYEISRQQLDSLQVFILGGREVNPVLDAWANIMFKPYQVCRFDPRAELSPLPDNREDIVCAARNEIVRRFLESSDKPWLVMLDDDVYPLPATIPLLTSNMPLAACRIWGKEGKESHPGEDVVCLSAVKISREVLGELSPPYFEFVQNEAHENQQCECMVFSHKAVEAGYAPVKVGSVGHEIPYVAFLLDEGLQLVPKQNVPMPRPSDFRQA